MNSDEVQNLYTDLNTLSRRKAWPDLELHFYHFAQQHSGPELADLIRSVNLDDYISRLNNFLKRNA